MKISREEVHHVADLSKLFFSEGETAEFVTTLPKIVDMVGLLNEVDIEDVSVVTTMADHKTVMHEDVAIAGDDYDELFKSMPQPENYYIKIPAILEDKGDA